MPAPVCGCSTMSLRSMVLKRPLRARSLLTTVAASIEVSAESAARNGTTAIGTALSCPRVTSTTNSAPRLCDSSKHASDAAKATRVLFIGFEPECKISLEQRRIRRIRQGRGAIHGILDRLAHRPIPVALSHFRARDLASGNLRHLDQTIYTDLGRGWLDPGVLNSIAKARNVAILERARLHGVDVLLLSDLLAQIFLALLACTLGSGLCIGRLFGLRGFLGVLRGTGGLRGGGYLHLFGGLRGALSRLRVGRGSCLRRAFGLVGGFGVFLGLSLLFESL